MEHSANGGAPSSIGENSSSTVSLSPSVPDTPSVDRPELAPISAAIAGLAGSQDHPLLVSITGLHGSGKSTALRQLVAVAHAHQVPAILIDLLDLAGSP